MGAVRTDDGRLCVVKEDEIETLSKEPVLDCSHREVESCHFTYITQFSPAQEKQCQENFAKICQITFGKSAVRDTVLKCYTPLVKVCNGQGPNECRTEYETSCTTRYVEQTPGKFIGDTKCEKVALEVCGEGCITEEAPGECHEKTTANLVDVPEESCDLQPQETCGLVTRLVPSLRPTRECAMVPQETCTLKFKNARVVKRPLKTEWCLDEVVPRVGGGVGDNREDDNPNLPTQTGGGGFDEPPGSSYGSPPPSESYSADFIKVAQLRSQLENLRRIRKELS